MCILQSKLYILKLLMWPSFLAHDTTDNQDFLSIEGRDSSNYTFSLFTKLKLNTEFGEPIPKEKGRQTTLTGQHYLSVSI